MKVTYYVAASIDGFIARENGDVSWLDDMNIDMADTGYDDFFASVDGIAMGRNTYDFVFNYGSWPYGDKPTWVCTNRGLEKIEGANLKIAKTSDDIVKEAELMGLSHLWLVGGGKLASSFLEKGFLTHLIITEMPIKLEKGVPLFSDLKLSDILAKKTETVQKIGFKQLEVTLSDQKAHITNG
jgi:dihydrofolate reductase